jgi:hypothetical protein
MIIKWFCKALKFLWRETEADVLLLVGMIISGWLCWNMDSNSIYFTSWLMVIAFLYGVCWLACLGALFLLLGSEKLNEGGL